MKYCPTASGGRGSVVRMRPFDFLLVFSWKGGTHGGSTSGQSVTGVDTVVWSTPPRVEQRVAGMS